MAPQVPHQVKFLDVSHWGSGILPDKLPPDFKISDCFPSSLCCLLRRVSECELITAVVWMPSCVVSTSSFIIVGVSVLNFELLSHLFFFQYLTYYMYIRSWYMVLECSTIFLLFIPDVGQTLTQTINCMIMCTHRQANQLSLGVYLQATHCGCSSQLQLRALVVINMLYTVQTSTHILCNALTYACGLQYSSSQEMM